jgi:hypothetical protein
MRHHPPVCGSQRRPPTPPAQMQMCRPPTPTCANANVPVAGRERGGVMERRGGGKGCVTGVDEIRRGEGGQAAVGGRGRAGCG